MEPIKGSPGVEILLSTYNGGEFIAEQLDSLLAQTYANWTLVVRDDGSTDDTAAILGEYARSHPRRMSIVTDGHKRLGACRSFSLLLARSTAPYVMFCDQDDVWLPGKVELTLERMLEAEGESPGSPVLVHTDMKVADKSLNVVSGSFWRYQNLDAGEKSLSRLLVHNNVTGCTAMVNAALRQRATPVPEAAILHDWWLALVASAFGRIIHLEGPTVLYRQHGGNVAGAESYSLGYFARRAFALGETARVLRRVVAQAGAFHSMYSGELPDREREAAGHLAAILQKGRVVRPFTLFRYGLRGHGFLRNLGIITLLVLMAGGGAGPGADL